MSNVDSAWLRMDSPANLMMVSGALSFENKVSFEDAKKLVAARLLKFPRFRQRVVTSNGLLKSIRWEEDPDFDIDRHFVEAELPSPGGEEEFQELASRLMSEPLDHDHPLWQTHFIPDFMGGSAMLCRFHHCMGDGIAMIYVMMSMTDDTPDAPLEKEFKAGKESNGAMTLEDFGRSLGRNTGKAINATTELLAKPGKAASFVTALGKLVAMPADPETPFKGELVREKRAVCSKPIELGTVKSIRKHTGATVNDVLLAAVSGALRRYLLGRGEEADGIDIRAVVPVNLRSLEEAYELGNRFGVVFLPLPLGIEDSLLRIFEVTKRMNDIKDSQEALVSFGILQTMGASPGPVFDRVLQMFGSKATTVMTNVIGPDKPIYFAGSAMKQAMFWVPRSGGLGMGISILSYNGQVLLGISTDAGLVPDPEKILDGFYDEFEEMIGLVEQVGG
jgi:WS/DGAT/MGAT family acyltransferase